MMQISRYVLLWLTLGLFLVGVLRDQFDLWVDRTEIANLVPEVSAEMRGRDGTLLRAFTVTDGRWRLDVSPDAVDDSFVTMLIAYEDKRFYQHKGVDLWAISRAAAQAVWHGEIVSGASTLTMQTARLLEESGTGVWSGKLRQMRVALALERQLSKREILRLYLTLAPYGGNLEGIRAATLSYFGKEPRRLTPSESGLLVALPQSPEQRRPDLHPEAARLARNRVLRRVAAQGRLAEETLNAALASQSPTSRRPFPSLAPHMTDRMRRSNPSAKITDLTLDPDLQRHAELLARSALRDMPDTVSIAMMLADHRTGEILVSIGSAGYSQTPRDGGFIDMTQAVRSPGSTLKPLVYALAFDQGLAHPATLIWDRPVSFGRYAPQNFDGHFRGEVRVDQALQLSLNIPVVLLTEELGPMQLFASLRKAGVQARLPGGQPGLALALGGVGVSLHDLVALYGGLAQGGRKLDLVSHLSARASVRTGARFVSRSAAWQVGHILSGLPPPAGAAKNRLAYKTGTSYGHRDAWAIGFDGRYVAGVWIGRPDGTAIPGAFGGTLAAPILFELIGLSGDQVEPLPPPPPETLLLDTSALPAPLQKFRGRHAVFEAAADAPKLTFPPDGASLQRSDQGLPVKLRDGHAPFTWLVNGRPLVSGSHHRVVNLPFDEPGFVQVSVIDALGRSARASFKIE